MTITANSDRTFAEANYDNNVAQLAFKLLDIPRDQTVDFGYIPRSTCPVTDVLGNKTPAGSRLKRIAMSDDAAFATILDDVVGSRKPDGSERRLTGVSMSKTTTGVFTQDAR